MPSKDRVSSIRVSHKWILKILGAWYTLFASLMDVFCAILSNEIKLINGIVDGIDIQFNLFSVLIKKLRDRFGILLTVRDGMCRMLMVIL